MCVLKMYFFEFLCVGVIIIFRPFCFFNDYSSTKVHRFLWKLVIKKITKKTYPRLLF